MQNSYNRHPLPPLLVIALAAFVGLMLALFFVEALAYAYQRIGISEGLMFALLLASLLGGAINIPVARLRGHASASNAEMSIFGARYRVPIVAPETRSTLAVNVGGALIPTGVSIALVVKDDIWWHAAAGVAVVAVVAHLFAKRVPGVGIAIPPLIPPLTAAAISLTILPHRAAALAYISGSLGTLIGADLLNLRHMDELGAGVVSIGGAGTFDGVFLSGVLAVLLVAIS